MANKKKKPPSEIRTADPTALPGMDLPATLLYLLYTYTDNGMYLYV